jgi:hypothetical protein
MNTYQLLICIDCPVPEEFGGETISLTTRETTEDTLEVLKAANITPADLRARTLVVFSSAPHAALLMYAALCGFAGRRLDFLSVADSDEIVPATRIGQFAAGLGDAGKPNEPAEFAQVGANPPSELGLTHVPSGVELDPAQIAVIRHTKKLRFAPGDSSTRSTLLQFATVCGLRLRGTAERYPILVDADAPLTDGDGNAFGVDLDQLRRDASGLRRAVRSDDRSAIVEFVAPTERLLRLAEAAAAPLDGVLVRLGSHRNENTGLWRCPRPERHKNGDANPSTKVDENGLICYRCDLEPIDSLRVVIDTLNIAPDQAADWIMSGAPRPTAA